MEFAEGESGTQARRTELIWIGIVGAWGAGALIALAIMLTSANFSQQNTTHQLDSEAFLNRVEALVERYSTTSSIDPSQTVVKPPPGSHIYMTARLWEWWPSYELQANSTYHLHLMSMDWVHGFALSTDNLELDVLPGEETEVSIMPTRAGRHTLACSVYCGVGHEAMTGSLYVTNPADTTQALR